MKKSRGIRIKTRTILSLILLAIQLLIISNSIIRFTDKITWINSLAFIIGIGFVIHIVTVRGNQSYKIMWIIFILIVPVFGVLAYLLFGGRRVFPHIKKKFKKCNEKYFSLLNSNENSSALIYNDMLHFRQAAFLTNVGKFPIMNNTKSTFLKTGEEFFNELLTALSKAEKYIYIEFFILGEGYMWDKIFEILKEKAKNNIEIKIIFDDFGSIKRQGENFVSNIKKYGIEISAFNPIRPSIDIFMNNRNHRKIVIIDGETAFTGGINIGDEYINKMNRFGHWSDCGIMLKGTAVNTFLAMFCSMWEFTTGKSISINEKFSSHNQIKDGFYIPYCDDPLDEVNIGQGIYMEMLNTAQKYVYIETPYLILDNTMIASLCLAAKSGIDVRIITPNKPDKWYVHPVTQYYYSELLDAGVKIFEYLPGFIHSKVFISDDSVATVGTVNMDNRSFVFHFECGAWICDNDTVTDIKVDMIKVIEESKEIKIDVWKKRPLFKRLLQAILYLFAPLM